MDFVEIWERLETCHRQDGGYDEMLLAKLLYDLQRESARVYPIAERCVKTANTEKTAEETAAVIRKGD